MDPRAVRFRRSDEVDPGGVEWPREVRALDRHAGAEERGTVDARGGGGAAGRLDDAEHRDRRARRNGLVDRVGRDRGDERESRPARRELLDRDGHGGPNGIEIARDEVRDDPPAVEAVDQDRRVGTRGRRARGTRRSAAGSSRAWIRARRRRRRRGCARSWAEHGTAVDRLGPMPTHVPRDLAPLVVIGGPTATGKTGLAIELAAWLIARGRPAEIVSADSRQVYRGLDIGTAKGATAAERARVVHHGLDLVDPDQPFSVAEFRDHALAALRALGARGGIGVLAGGTGFWLRAVMAGLDTDALPSDPAVRASIEHDLEADGLDAIAGRLTATAPSLAARTDLRNPRRVVRGLEIATIRGDVALPQAIGYPAPVLGLQLAIEPADHRHRIADRAHAQFEAGLIEEARALRERYDSALPAFSAIGYRESWAVIDGEAQARAGDRARPRPAERPVRPPPAHVVPPRALARGHRRGRGPSPAALERLERFVDRMAHTPPAGILTTP